MREIKFRAKPLGCPYHEWQYGGIYFCEYEKKYYMINIIDEYQRLFCEVNQDSIGQFTGLKDKNGKEIYEGDVCRIRTVDDEGQFIDNWENTEIWFYEGKFLTRYYGFPVSSFCRDKSEIEVIGNIHENPD